MIVACQHDAADFFDSIGHLRPKRTLYRCRQLVWSYISWPSAVTPGEQGRRPPCVRPEQRVSKAIRISLRCHRARSKVEPRGSIRATFLFGSRLSLFDYV